MGKFEDFYYKKQPKKNLLPAKVKVLVAQAVPSEVLVKTVPPLSELQGDPVKTISVGNNEDGRMLAAVSNSSQSYAVAKSLISSYLLDTVRGSTRSAYQNYWSRFQKFCEESSPPLSMSPKHVSAFLISLAEKTKGKSSSLQARAAIKFYFKMKHPRKRSPTDSWYVSRIVNSIKKKWSKPVKKATVIDSDILKKVIKFLILDPDVVQLKEERLAVLLLLQFCIFGRFEEVESLKVSDLKFLQSGDLAVVIPKAKNFESWDARTSYIAANPGGEINAVQIIAKYIARLGYEEDGFLFPSLKSVPVCKKDLKVRRTVVLLKPISYSNTLKEFRSVLDSIGLIGRNYSLHSPRTGGLSEAANSGRCSQNQLKRHGRWSSVKMADYYHKMLLEMKLQASRSLGILS